MEKDNENYQYILTLDWELSRFIEAHPFNSKDTVTVAKASVDNFIPRYGCPSEVAAKETHFH